MHISFFEKGAVWVWVKTMFFRITISKITTCFFLFSFLHCLIHSIVQSILYSYDHEADALASSIIKQAGIPQDEVAWLTRSDGVYTLKLCTHVPINTDHKDNCTLIFQSNLGSEDVPPGYKRDLGLFTSNTDISIEPIEDSNGMVSEISLRTSSVDNDQVVSLTKTCTRVLSYADQVVKNSRREELALIGSEFWLFGLSVFAVMYNSVPHLLAGLAMRVLSAIWSGYAIWRTFDIEKRFKVLITDGACGVDLFPGYFKDRMIAQIVDVVLNIVALCLSLFLVWRLVKIYHEKTFSRVGAPPEVHKMYKSFLVVLTCLQMAVYFLVTANALWIDQLFNGPLVNISSHNIEYIIGFTILNVLLLPWIAIGWFSIRREMKRTMWTFLGLGTFYILSWGFLYYSQVFRWTWIQWPFFACMSLSAQIAELACVILAIVCYKNFHRGLASYLRAEDALARADFEPEVFTNDTENPRNSAFEVNFKSISVYSDTASIFESKVDHDLKYGFKYGRSDVR